MAKQKAPAFGRCLGHVVLLDEIAGLEGDMAIEGDGEIGDAVAIGINLQDCLRADEGFAELPDCMVKSSIHGELGRHC